MVVHQPRLKDMGSPGLGVSWFSGWDHRHEVKGHLEKISQPDFSGDENDHHGYEARIQVLG